MADKRLNDLLRWSVENSDVPHNDPSPELMAALMGGPSDADLMKASMEIITSPDSEVTLENKLIAFDNLEQLIESLDNANNIGNLGLWTPLLEQLTHQEAEVRKMAAWCIGTAVQSNQQTQERLYAMGGVPALVGMATRQEEKEDVRKKAVYALSSACRNYQPAMDVCVEEVSKNGHDADKVDARDMEAVDVIINVLRDKVKNSG